ncbi:MAG: tRNA pseudouridine(55) synthase TruB [Atopobiaceae bacterium]|nr:tRNA pseudouridine(55) synthase TruB [Atopobiaceae bacterium]
MARRGGRRRRRSSGLNLLIAIDKPYGEVTRAVDNRVGRAIGDSGVGHIGTLDPAVTGVLVLAVGQATKLINHIEEGRTKTYVATISFGTQTTTDDAQGEVLRMAEVPQRLRDEGFARAAIEALRGPGKQRPPCFSAIKVNGVRAYELAREGVEFELPERDMYVYDARLLDIHNGDRLSWRCEFVVSSGTYIRAIARDVGIAVGSAAHLSSLCRTGAGAVTLDDCVTLEQVEDAGREGVSALAIDPTYVLGLPVYKLSEQELERARNGVPFVPTQTPDADEGERIAIVRQECLYGIWRMDEGRLRPMANCPKGIEGVRI